VTQLSQIEDFVHWSADGRSVLIGVDFTRPVRIDRLDLSSGRRTLWRLLSSGGRMGAGGLTGLVLSANEEIWVAGYQRWFTELLVIDGLR